MFRLSCFIIALSTGFLLASALPTNGSQPRATCRVTSYTEVDGAVSSCTDIIIDGVTVPAGKALRLYLKEGTTLTFERTIKFDYKEWGGPLVDIQGTGITIQGGAGSVLDGQGPLYWDGLGGNGGKAKPRFIKIKASGQINNINVLNCPVHCVSIGNSHGLTLSGWNIDVSAGDTGGGHNTDGFDISSSSDLTLKDSVIKNQDDCVAVNQGSDMMFSGLSCSGSHGLSMSVGKNSTNPLDNIVSNITFSDCSVVNARNGIHLKTHPSGTTGYIKDVTYRNIILSGITFYGINVEEDYDNGGPTGIPRGNIPISNLQMINIKGVVNSDAMPVYILCGTDGCSDWTWSGVSISGGSANECNFAPTGYRC